MTHGSHLRVVGLPAALYCAVDPRDRGGDRQRDAQQGQKVPEGDHQDDAGEDPERGDLCVMGAVVFADRGRGSHVYLASIGARRWIRKRLLKQPGARKAARSGPIVTHFTRPQYARRMALSLATLI